MKRKTRVSCQVALTMAVAIGLRLVAQVQTQVPPVVPGAKPVTVEHIRVHIALSVCRAPAPQ